MGIAWYIKMEVFRTAKLPSYYHIPHVHKCKDIALYSKQAAKIVYNEMYRNTLSGKFVVTDIDDKNLNGRIGYIDYYDEKKLGYRTIICSEGSSNVNTGFPMFMKTEFMNPWTQIQHSQYNANAIQKEVSIEVDLPPHLNRDPHHVTVREEVLRKICGVHGEKRPERPDESVTRYDFMKNSLQSIEQKELEHQSLLASQQKEHEEAMNKLLSSHETDNDRPYKKPKRNFEPHSRTDDPRIKAVLKAKMEHFRQALKPECQHNNVHQELLFSFPFKTYDNTLSTCSDELRELNVHHDCCSNVSDDILQHATSEPLVMTTRAAMSLKPGCDINSDVLDFCLGW